MTTVDLRDEALLEGQRLLAARTLAHEGDEAIAEQLETEGPWIATTRSTSLRSVLRGRCLQIWRVAFDDAHARRAESRLVALALDAGVSISADDVAESVEQAASTWRDEATKIQARFSGARLTRERLIEAAQTASSTELQPGLFDRRAAHLHAERAAAHASSAAEGRERLANIERAALLCIQPPRLMLAIGPKAPLKGCPTKSVRR